MRIVKNGLTIVRGTRNTTDGLWDISLPLPPTAPIQVANAIVKKSATHADLADCGSPPLRTFLRAIKNGNLITWPGIRDVNFNKHLTKSLASAKGHLNQERKNLQSTKPPSKPVSPSSTFDDDDFFPAPTSSPPVKTFEVLSTIIPFEANGKAFHDLTGRFPHRSYHAGIPYPYQVMSQVIIRCQNLWNSRNTSLVPLVSGAVEIIPDLQRSVRHQLGRYETSYGR